jgi:hypothetical protein
VSRAVRVSIVGLATAGAISGHLLGYLVVYPYSNDRQVHLAVSGHGSFGTLAAVATAAGALALVVLTIRACRKQALEFRWLAGRLVTLQLVIFAVLELAERGFDPAGTLADPAVLVGFAAQVLVALAVAVLARGVEDLVRSIRSRIPRTLRAPPRLPRPAATAFPPGRSVLQWDARRRAPPVPLTG